MPSYASPTDIATFGEYKIKPHKTLPLYRFAGRLTADGSSGYPAESGRYHLYAGWFCPWAQRVTIQRALNGLEDAISLSYVDNSRDARGWAFREATGPDPVNGFTLLREAYEATQPGFDGHVSVPTLWDRVTGRIVSNDFKVTGIDLATQFGGGSTYVDGVEDLDAWIGPAVNRGGDLPGAFAELERRLADRRYLLGDSLTEADVRLWVSLVRYRSDTDPLTGYPNLWDYARDLYQRPAFRDTTRFDSFTPAGTVLPDWDAPVDRVHVNNLSKR